MKKKLLFIIMLITAVMASAQELTGSWNGKLSVAGAQLNIVFNISQNDDGSMKCTLDSPDQGAKGIPAEISVTDGTKVKISVPAIMASYEGELKDGRMKGMFTQSGMSFPLDMKPGAVQRNRPQTPAQPYPYSTEEVTVSNKEDNVTLSGTLTYPVDYDKMKKEDVPVVVMVTGSGSQNRDEEVFDHKPFLIIADYLARNGIASLRYDDRGTGKSTGNPALSDSENYMKDAIAAIEYVRGSGKFGKTGVLGHSEGGMIAFMLAAQGKADFIVSMAGPGIDCAKILVEQNRHTLAQTGMPANLIDDYCKSFENILKAANNGADLSNPESLVQTAVRDAGANLPEPMVENLSEVVKTCNTPWMKYFIKYDPTENIKATKCPVMAVNGEKDTQVAAGTNLNAIKSLLPDNAANVVKEYSGLNHLFQQCTTGNVNEYAQIEQTISPEVLKDIAGWINKVK